MIKFDMTRLKQNENGFTLIEAMISLVIISTGMLGLIPMFEVSFMANASGRNTTVANRLMSQNIELVRAINFDNVAALILENEDYSAKEMTTETVTIDSTDYNLTKIVATYNEPGNTLNSHSFQFELSSMEGYPFPGLIKISAIIEWSDPMFGYGGHSVSGITYLESL